MKLGIVIYSNDSETVWNAFRYGNYALNVGDNATIFLMGKGVELESLDTETFNVTPQMRKFVDGGGKMFACGTCLDIHRLEPSEVYVVATLEDLHKIVSDCDKLITF